MRKTAGYTHFWQVRGRGFTDKQWRAILSLTAEIISNAAENDISIAGPDGTGEPVLGARGIQLNGAGAETGQPFLFAKEADPAWGRCKTNHLPYDAVVVSILTAAKKVAPDVLEISSDGGRDVFKRIFAMSDQNLFAKTVKLATEQPDMRPKLLPVILRHASVDKVAQRRFLVAYAKQNPDFRDELVRRLYAARGVTALEHATEEARKKYLKDHPGADPSAHTVKKKDDDKNKAEKKDDKKEKSDGGAVGEKNLADGAKASQVHGNAVVHGNAKIKGKAEVGGHAVVYGNASVEGESKVGQDAEIFGKAEVYGKSEVSGEAKISGTATIDGGKISGKAQVNGDATVRGPAKIGGSAHITDEALIGGQGARPPVINGGKISGRATVIAGTWENTDAAFGQWKGPKGPEAVKKNNLTEADTDEVLEKIVNKKGQMLSPAQLFAKFMAEAKPETKERMKDMSIAEFMDVVKFMADDEEVDAASGGGKTASLQITDEQLKSAAIRVAYKSKDPELRRRIALALKESAEEGEKDSKFEEGSNPSDEEITKGMSAEEKAKWMANKGKVQDKKAYIKRLASTAFPKTPTKIAEKWIQDAIKRPGRVREYLGIPEGQDIPMGKLDAAIEKVKGTGDQSLLSALLLAKRLKQMG